ncbi:MAG TPA: hypothetical protein DHW82_11155 [Spirochaetia bacterium]|nr:MAG: hypothetical protein A2Y41_02205 [Spirochaetes bacterium GWB1_36_13]HCL57550.1 hypothetical protein [Spirochaetia bacterium]
MIFLRIFFFLFLIVIPLILEGNNIIFVNNVMIQGNNAFTRSKILEVLDMEPGVELPYQKIKKSIGSLIDYYHNEGYRIAKIESFFDLNQNLIIEIQEGLIQEVIFLNLNYYQVYATRVEFGDYKDRVFYQPVMDKKLNAIKNVIGASDFDYDFVPVKERKGYYLLFLSKKSKPDPNIPVHLAKEIHEFYADIDFNFRGWLLSLVPYVDFTLYNIGNIDHILRLGVDVRFATLNWFYLKFLDSIQNEYYTLNYFSPPFYKDLRFNFYSGALINRGGRGDLGVNFKTIRFPFELGFGFDLKYFWASLRTGFLYEKLRNLSYNEDSLVTLSEPYTYFELTKETDNYYNSFTLNLNHTISKKYMKEKDDTTNLAVTYTFNEKYSWFSTEFNLQRFFVKDYDLFVLRYRTVFMTGKYPVYYQFALPNEFHLRGYGALSTDRGMDASFEIWNSISKDNIHNIIFIDTGWFHNMTYRDTIATGDFGLSYGIGVSFSFYEMTLRLYYALPIKQRADQGSFDFFFRRRF